MSTFPQKKMRILSFLATLTLAHALDPQVSLSFYPTSSSPSSDTLTSWDENVLLMSHFLGVSESVSPFQMILNQGLSVLNHPLVPRVCLSARSMRRFLICCRTIVYY